MGRSGLRFVSMMTTFISGAMLEEFAIFPLKTIMKKIVSLKLLLSQLILIRIYFVASEETG